MAEILRIRWVLVRYAVVFVAAAGIGCASAQPRFVQPNYSKWRQIVPGMSESQVNSILGPPLKPGSPSLEFTAYDSTYGVLEFPEPPVCAQYEFAIEFDCKSRTVNSKFDPFNGDLSSTGVPTSPRLITPTDKQIFDHYPRFMDFRWQPSSGTYPIRYEVQLKYDWYQSKEWNSNGVVTKSVSEPYLCFAWVGKGRGVWRVRAHNQDGIGNWSETRTFEFLR